MALPRMADIDPTVVGRVLQDLYGRAAGNAYEERMVVRDEADFWEGRGELDKAIQLTERALAITRQIGADPAEVRRDTMNLVLRRLASADAAQRDRAEREIADIGADETLAQVLLGRATATLSRAGVAGLEPGELSAEQRSAVASAERDIAQAEQCKPSEAQRGEFLLAKTGICRILGRDEEGLAATAEAIAYFREHLPASRLPAMIWSDRLHFLESLYGYRISILIRQRPPRLREAFECADECRAQLLRHELVWAQESASTQARSLRQSSYDAVTAVLRQDHAALALFDVGDRSSAVFVVDPAEPEPIHRPIDLTSAELAGLMPGQEDLAYAKERVFAAVTSLSGKLLPALTDVIERYQLLYLIPTSALYGVPFAALTLADGSRLVEHCATAYLPSASLLQWCIGRRRELHQRTLVALGVGEATDRGQRIPLAPQAKDVIDRAGQFDGVSGVLLPESTTAIGLLDAAEQASVLHLECHGLLDPAAGSLTASYLELSGNERLTPQAVTDRANRLAAELVFLNACLSGTFAPQMRNEAGGFWQAFFIGGTSSLVATLSPILVEPASELVSGFYEAWLGRGLDKARALQASQLAMVAAGRAPQDWATHILIGDGR